MSFRYSKNQLEGREAKLQRILEILPGATSWTILIGMVLLTFWKPVWAAVLVISFDLYWLLRLLYMTFFLVLSYVRLSMENQTDWMAKIGGLDTMDSRDIRHVVIIPVAKESRDVFEPGIRSLAHQQFPAKQILVVLAVEERATEEIKKAALAVQQRHRSFFLDFLVTFHPDGLPGEARVKGANATYAAKAAARELEQKGIPLEKVIVSCFDADTVVSPHYVPCVTYQFMVCPQRTRASFQPIPVYHNNIWEVPGFSRVLDVGSSSFQLIEATNPEKLVTFSSHSMSFKALVEIGYWPVDMISDDSAIFWKAFLHYEGDYRVVPMYVTVSMDVAASDSWQKTVINVYRQKRRWAWGVENFPIVMRGFLQSKKLPLSKKITSGFKLFESNVAWATWPFLLGVISWLPAFFAGLEFSNSVVYYTAPRITGTIFRLASISLLTTILLSFSILPKARTKNPLLTKIGHAMEWLLVPVTAVFLSALPALDAQTRLMMGRYMEFWVTDKKR